jgi:hypothetical protein
VRGYPTLPPSGLRAGARFALASVRASERLLCTVALGGRINFVSCGSGSDAVGPGRRTAFIAPTPRTGFERGRGATNGHG